MKSISRLFFERFLNHTTDLILFYRFIQLLYFSFRVLDYLLFPRNWPSLSRLPNLLATHLFVILFFDLLFCFKVDSDVSMLTFLSDIVNEFFLALH